MAYSHFLFEIATDNIDRVFLLKQAGVLKPPGCPQDVRTSRSIPQGGAVLGSFWIEN
jgi:hypothetical protein